MRQSSALVSPTKPLTTDLVRIGDDIELIEAPREDVEMGTMKMKNHRKQKFPESRMNPKNPKSREKQEHDDSGHAVYRTWCVAFVEGRADGVQNRIESLGEVERERTTPTVAFDDGDSTHEDADMLPFLMCRDSGYGRTRSTCC